MTEIRQSFFAQISKIGSIETKDGKINTDAELKELGSYLNGTKKFDFEMTETEKTELQKIYDKAKKWINDNVYKNNEDKKATNTDSTSEYEYNVTDNEQGPLNAQDNKQETDKKPPSGDDYYAITDVQDTLQSQGPKQGKDPIQPDDLQKDKPNTLKNQDPVQGKEPPPSDTDERDLHKKKPDTLKNQDPVQGKDPTPPDVPQKDEPETKKSLDPKDNQKIRQGGKQKIVNGKRVIVMPNGDLYDLNGRKIKN